LNKHEHGGNVYLYDIEHDFSANINPLGMPDSVKRAVISAVDDFEKYPDPNCTQLGFAVCEHERVPRENIVFGNGASDLIYRIVSAFKPRNAIVFSPTFSEYKKALQENGAAVREILLNEESNFAYDDSIIGRITSDTDMMFLCSPNNPAGNVIEPGLLKRITRKCLDENVILVADECFIDFVQDSSRITAKNFLYKNLIILKAFTKIYAMAGLRLGYAIFGDRKNAEHVRRNGSCWSVSVPAQTAGIAAVKETKFISETVELIGRERGFLTDSLNESGIKTYPSEVNFIFFRCEAPLDELLLKHKILIRRWQHNYFRIAVRTREENIKLISAIKEVLHG
jgi:threonine-phosphate decarboxylase